MCWIKSSQTILLILLLVLCNLGCSFVLSANMGDTTLFDTGHAWLYKFETAVTLSEINPSSQGTPVGFKVSADALVQSIWGSNDYERILRITLKDPYLMVHDGVKHKSKLDTMKNQEYYLKWTKGRIEKIFLPKGEEVALLNMKRGLASLLQFQLLDMEVNETDASGECSISYTSLSPTKFDKTKHNCHTGRSRIHRNPNAILDSIVSSHHRTEYHLDLQNKYLKKIDDLEKHQIYLAAKFDAGNFVEARQTLTFVKEESCEILTGTAQDVLYSTINSANYLEDSLVVSIDRRLMNKSKTFFAVVSEFKKNLDAKNFGKMESAESFLKLVAVGRLSKKEDIAKTLNAKGNQKIIHQLYDVLGFVQTLDAHEAVMKKLHFDDESMEDFVERYLWACSFTTQPNAEVLQNLLSKYKKGSNMLPKVKRTLISTVASMAFHLEKLPHNTQSNKIRWYVEETIINEIDVTKGEARQNLLHALYNLKSATTIPVLLKLTETSPIKEAALAWKVLRALPSEDMNQAVLKLAYKTFFQVNRRQDSSARAFAFDVLLESDPSDELLRHFIEFLASNDTAYEIKQYSWQRLQMKAGMCPDFHQRVWNIIKSCSRLNNYSTLGPRGLSTAMIRPFLNSSATSGHLMTSQEMLGGIVKQGVVNIEMSKDGQIQEIFSLGIFSGGLSSFFSSDDANGSDEPEESTAGMEISVLGNKIRPFVFFTGQGELMGHLWSGTASDKTTAFQALTLLQDHKEQIRLGSGFVLDFNVKGAVSFDLSGQVEFSLWNRKATSVIQKIAGVTIIGQARVDTSFVKSQAEFNLALEPKLHLDTTIDFATGINLCMQLSQLPTVWKHGIFKTESIPETKHSIRRTRLYSSVIPGKTYALNRKNTEMCNLIFA